MENYHMPEDFTFSEALDRDHLLMIYEGDLERASIIFQIFVNSIEGDLNVLKNLLRDQQTDEFARKVHKIGPNFAMVGLSRATEQLAEIEMAAKRGGLSLAVREKFEIFTEGIAPKIELVRTELSRINNCLNP